MNGIWTLTLYRCGSGGRYFWRPVWTKWKHLSSQLDPMDNSVNDLDIIIASFDNLDATLASKNLFLHKESKKLCLCGINFDGTIWGSAFV